MRRILATMMMLLMTTAALAGCAGSDVTQEDVDAAREEGRAAGIAEATPVSTLDTIIARGSMKCGVKESQYGMGYLDAGTGVRSGLDISYCRGVAAALGLNPDTDVEYIPASGSDRFDKLASGTIDVLIRTTTWTTSRDADLNADFAGMNFFDGQGILVRGDAFDSADSGNSASALNGAKICVGIGTTTEGDMVAWFDSRSISFTSVPVADAAEATAKFIDGACDAFVGEMSAMVDKKSQLDNDESMNGVDIWIANIDAGASDINSLVSNSLSITIQQNEDEMLTGFEYIYAQVSLYVTCIDNATDCNPFEYLFQSTTSVTGQFPGSTSKQMSPPSYGAMGASLFTTCSEGVEFFWYSGDISDLQYVFFPGTGLTCTHEFTFNSNQEAWNLDSEFDNYDVDKHIISWSDWTYSLVWESVPIDN